MSNTIDCMICEIKSNPFHKKSYADKLMIKNSPMPRPAMPNFTLQTKNSQLKFSTTNDLSGSLVVQNPKRSSVGLAFCSVPLINSLCGQARDILIYPTYPMQ